MNRPSYIDSNTNNYSGEVNSNASNPLYDIKPQPYRCMIKHVVDDQEHSCLIVFFDIAEGQLAGIFNKLSEGDFSKWNRKGKIWISYEETRKDIFEGFITSVKKSNINFVWDWNEQKLVGKNIVVLYGEEEFQTQDTREIKISIKPRMVRSLEALRNNEIVFPPQIKKLKTPTGKVNNNNKYTNQNYKTQGQVDFPNERQTPQFDVEIDDNDLPF